MTMICQTEFPSTMFMWHNKDRVLSADVSELTCGNGFRNPFTRIYNDACDEGFAIRSNYTNTLVVFAVSHVEVREGDILWWDLKPVKLGDNKLVTVRVFND
jgi:hypothetical protein